MVKEKNQEKNCDFCESAEEAVTKLDADKGSEVENKRSLWKLGIIFFVVTIVLGGGIIYKLWLSDSSQTASIVKTTSSQSTEAGTNGNNTNSPAPDFVTEDTSGNQIALQDFRDKKPVLVIFWATWCSFCKKELEDLKIFAQEHQDEIQVLTLASGEVKKTVENYVQEENIDFPVLLDEQKKIWNSYGARGTPSHFLVDKDGEIVFRQPGLASKSDLEIMLMKVQKL